MKSQSAARSYAKALHDLARERGQAEAVGTELAQAVDVVRTDPALAHFFARPGVTCGPWPWWLQAGTPLTTTPCSGSTGSLISPAGLTSPA